MKEQKLLKLSLYHDTDYSSEIFTTFKPNRENCERYTWYLTTEINSLKINLLTCEQLLEGIQKDIKNVKEFLYKKGISNTFYMIQDLLEYLKNKKYSIKIKKSEESQMIYEKYNGNYSIELEYIKITNI